MAKKENGIKLSIKDRLTMNLLLPKEGNIICMTVAKDVTDKVKLSQVEIKNVDLKVVEDNFKWNAKKDKGKVVLFTTAELEILRLQITKLDEQNKITLEILPLCEKIRDV